MTRTLAFLTAVALIGVSGAAAGLWTHRWVPSRSLQEAAARLHEVPLKLEDWDGTEGTLDERMIAQADLAGYIARKYTNRRSGAVVSVLIVCGRSGPVCVHTPDVCYTNSGYEQTATRPHRTAVTGAPPADFSVLDFRRTNVAVPSQMRLYLAWGRKEGWSAPKQPRFTFAREPVLYKMYVLREAPRQPEGAEPDPAAELIDALLPGLHEALFAGA